MKSPQDMRIIQIDITNACMYQCSNCTRFCGHHKKPFFMNYETFVRAVDSMKGYHGTIGVMGGEPTLHPEFDRFVRYLDSSLSKEGKKDHRSLVRPQKDFIESILVENKLNSEVYKYHTGARETVVGAGLWSAMVPTYKKHYELIQDVFKMQAVNDHGNIMYHSPILINRKDLGISDEKWKNIRDNCWAQEVWSATITPKGAFFCEIAGALDMLFDGPGGWPIEPGWWKRTPDQFGDQLRWCEYCGIAVETFTRNANDWVDDVSPTMYEKLKQIDSPKMKKEGSINLVQIHDGVISEESKRGAKEVRKDLFHDGFISRFNNQRSVLFPNGFDLVLNTSGWKDTNVAECIERNRKQFDRIVIMKPGAWGDAFYHALRDTDASHQIIYTDVPVVFTDKFHCTLDHTVINPGVMHLAEEVSDCDFVECASEYNSGVILMFHQNAEALRRAGMDRWIHAADIREFLSFWEAEKVIGFNSDIVEDTGNLRIRSNMKYAVYGAGPTGKAAIRLIREMNSEVVLLVDSDEKKWGTETEGCTICSPDLLPKLRDDYDQILIASAYYKDIKNRLNSLGLEHEETAIFE